MWKFALVLTALTVPMAAAEAGTPCSKRSDVIAELGKKYKEAPVAIGLASNGNLLEVLTSTDGSTWTIIQTAPTGIACMVAAGEGWQPKEPAQLASADPEI
jgi:hypothetical protein